MRLLHGFLGLIGGLFVGALGAVTYPGPLDMPIVGLLIATVLVGSGAWFLLAWRKKTAWAGYVLGIVVATFWLLTSQPSTDTVMSAYRWTSDVWLIAGPAAALLPRLFVHDHKRVR